MDFDEYYRDAHPSDSTERSHLWHPRNPVWVAHRHQIERGLLRALDVLEADGADLGGIRAAEVGCGSARHLRFLREVGVWGALLGVDLLNRRLVEARSINPGLQLIQGDAVKLPVRSGGLDLALQLVAFSSILDHSIRRAAADELRRVVRSGGWIVTYDVVRANPGSIPDGMEAGEVEALFPSVRWLHRARLHHRLLSRAARQPWLAELCERLPIPKSNLLMVGRFA